MRRIQLDKYLTFLGGFTTAYFTTLFSIKTYKQGSVSLPKIEIIEEGEKFFR